MEYTYKLNEKENFLRLLSGEMPEYIPAYDMGGWMLSSSVKFGGGINAEGKQVNEYGVEFVGVPTAPGGAALPKPGDFILEDIADWQKVIHTPEIPTDIDWEAVAKKDLEAFGADHKPVIMTAGDYFQNLMAFMGFTEGLCAMYESPDDVYDLFTYIGEYNLAREKIYLQYYKPDIWYILDDNATKLNPFISPEMNRELLIPFQRAQADLAREAGCRILMHDCGRCEDFIEDWIDIGVNGWDPAQIENDLLGIKAKYGRKLALIGAWDSQGAVSLPETADEVLIEALYQYVDTFAPGGGFAWQAGVLGSPGDKEVERKDALAKKIYEEYAKPWYKNHGG